MTINEDLIGKVYIDEQDSGELIMEVFAISQNFPDTDVAVRVVDKQISTRQWTKSARLVRAVISEIIRDINYVPEKSLLERQYLCNGKRYWIKRYINKYSLVFLDGKNTKVLLIDNKRFWGSSVMGWKRIEQLAFPVIKKHAFES